MDTGYPDKTKTLSTGSELISVSEMGKILGLKKTERYWLLHKELFESKVYLGKLWVVRDSFEEWYSRQVKYHKVNGEEPGTELKKYSYSVRDIARLLAVNEATAYELIERYHLETIEVDHWHRVPKAVFDTWYRSQSKYRNKEDRERDKDIEKNSISMPQMARLLGVARHTVYSILKNNRYGSCFEIIEVAGQKRITWDSFNSFLDKQEKYYMKTQTGSASGKLANHRKRKQLAGEKDNTVRNIGNSEFLTIEEAMLLAAVSRQTIAKWIRKEYFPAMKMGGSVHVCRREFETWLAKKRKK